MRSNSDLKRYGPERVRYTTRDRSSSQPRNYKYHGFTKKQHFTLKTDSRLKIEEKKCTTEGSYNSKNRGKTKTQYKRYTKKEESEKSFLCSKKKRTRNQATAKTRQKIRPIITKNSQSLMSPSIKKDNKSRMSCLNHIETPPTTKINFNKYKKFSANVESKENGKSLVNKVKHSKEIHRMSNLKSDRNSILERKYPKLLRREPEHSECEECSQRSRIERTYNHLLLKSCDSRLENDNGSLQMDSDPLRIHNTLNYKRKTIVEDLEGENDCSDIGYSTRIGNDGYNKYLSFLMTELEKIVKEKSGYKEKYKKAKQKIKRMEERIRNLKSSCENVVGRYNEKLDLNKRLAISNTDLREKNLELSCRIDNSSNSVSPDRKMVKDIEQLKLANKCLLKENEKKDNEIVNLKSKMQNLEEKLEKIIAVIQGS
ncbi:unnamed protein product [Moneuplotes crassus]|uniref:Uncharacterized protein n=1 Tax=Euplotes crassus TaxID=5936 RepID=A0AAD1Y9S5_EUPCR|nr:unnamed protein product [Moneuplotes crassus]